MSAIPPLSDSLQTEQLSTDVTTTFVLNSAYLVFFMHCGFAMVRSLNLLEVPQPDSTALLHEAVVCAHLALMMHM